MRCSIEEEELRAKKRLDNQDDAGCDDCQKANDVADSNGVQDDVAWSSSRLLGKAGERHD